MRHSIFFLATLALCACTERQVETKDFTQFVNPFIGTDATGHTFPGACTPFGLVQASPETNATGWQHCSGYQYGDTLIWGFSQTHLNGTGCIDLGDILIQPLSGQRIREDYRSAFDKQTETASPGYYAVHLTDDSIKAEITATPHVAVYQFDFLKNDTTSLLIDFQHGLTWNDNGQRNHVLSCNVALENDTLITGESQLKEWAERHLAYALQFNRPITDVVKLPKRNEFEKGERWIVTFAETDKPLQVKIGLSPHSIAEAKQNLSNECPDWDFAATRENAKEKWNASLACAEIEGNEDEHENFYTALYHLMQQPHCLAGDTYSTFSLWDTYRAAHPLYTILTPSKAGAFVNSMIAHGEAQAYLPIWALWGYETHCMIGNHAVPVIVDAILKGIPGIDEERAYATIRKSLTTPHEKSEWDVLNKHGYYPSDRITSESVSRTLETCIDDYAAALLAERLGHTDDAAFFMSRAGNYKNLFDTTTCFMRPRLSDGTWKSPFDPTQLAHAESIGGDYTEGNAWQYTWHVQHDAEGLINLFPSKESFLNRLNGLFTAVVDTTQKLSDVTGLIGQYAHGNEPSHHVTYLYALAGEPRRTQELIREIFDTQYKNTPEGLCGNDDCGQMSAWYLFNAMGFYPFNPVGGEYILGAPQLKRITLNLENGKTFTIIAKNLSEKNKYVRSVSLNGKQLTRHSITHDEIMQGGELIFEMEE